MSLVYRNTYEGVDSFSKLLHKIGTDCDACVAIRNRKDLLFIQVSVNFREVKY
jgi:hypothetical protein